MVTGNYNLFLPQRMRRMRKHVFSRKLACETKLSVDDLIYPMFVVEGNRIIRPIKSMPGINCFSIDMLLKEIESLVKLGIPAIMLFPVIKRESKSDDAKESYNPNGLIQRSISSVKRNFPDLGVITDVALDPYTVHGHDGIIDSTGYVLNDITVSVLVKQALSHVYVGADIVAPSDMMDGRVKSIRSALELNSVNTLIMSYSVKYNSAYYGPFRDAVGSKNVSSKSAYQMDIANVNEAFREVSLDIREGADIILIKPGMPYLDVISKIKRKFKIPIASYQVSGEYSMHMAAFKYNWLSERNVILESLLCLKRAGSDAIVTYFAKRAAQFIVDESAKL